MKRVGHSRVVDADEQSAALSRTVGEGDSAAISLLGRHWLYADLLNHLGLGLGLGLSSFLKGKRRVGLVDLVVRKLRLSLRLYLLNVLSSRSRGGSLLSARSSRQGL